MLAGHLMAHGWLVYNTPTSQSCCGRLCRYCQHILGYTGQEEAQAHSAKCFRALRDSRPQRNADAIHHRRGELREKFGQIGINTGSCDNLRLVCVHKYSGSLEHLQKILPLLKNLELDGHKPLVRHGLDRLGQGGGDGEDPLLRQGGAH